MKVNYDGLLFDSELEVEYYKYIIEKMQEGEIYWFLYHPAQIPNLVGKRSYTPDFLVVYRDRVEIVETKGYNPYSKMIDDAIHQAMLSKDSEWLFEYVFYCNPPEAWWRYINEHIERQNIVYKKVKYLKAYGFVEWDFKNPNTIANKRKEKITELSSELKELRQFKKDTVRYFNLHNRSKLTLNQKEFIAKYLNQFYPVEE